MKEHWIIRFFKWIGSSIEDKRGAVSWKRVLAFYGMFIYHQAALDPAVTWYKLAVSASVPLLLMGLTVPEWFSKGPLLNGEKIGQT